MGFPMILNLKPSVVCPKTLLAGFLDGMAVLNPTTCEITYTSDMAFVGNDVIEYKVCDTSPSIGPFCTTAFVNLEVFLGPTAVNDTTTTTQGIPVTIDVLNNDSPGGSPLDPSSVTIIDPPDNGIITSINPITGEIDYQPNSTFCGQDTFIYRVCDTLGFCDTAIVSVQVDCPPFADDDGAMPMPNVTECIDVLFNDVPGTSNINTSTVMLCMAPINGMAEVQTNGEICYTSDPGFTGNDDFTYKVADENGLFSNCANVEIIVVSMMTTTADTTTAATTTAATTTAATTTAVTTTAATTTAATTTAATTTAATTTAATTTAATTTAEPPTTAPIFGDCAFHLFLDVNFNQQQDLPLARRINARIEETHHNHKRQEEINLAGIRVTLTDSMGTVHMGVTDANGDVVLPNIPPGPATLLIEVPPGLELTTNMPNPSIIQVPAAPGVHTPPEFAGGIGLSRVRIQRTELSSSDTAILAAVGSILAIIVLIGLCSCCRITRTVDTVVHVPQTVVYTVKRVGKKNQ